ncbi:MAG: cytochrome c [Actinomycetota bacterium]|nr:cytochrome c [Actinomycetota bacterium]MDH5223320.1 cytochrome c [Actinomycetota bacterium]MDH5313927.1 cytochrome c [Actinomycetota bacterium]
MVAAQMLAETSTAGIVLLVLGAIFVVAAGAALYLRSRQKEQPLDIPRGMRPGPSDAALETPLLQKLQGWGVVLVAFFVIFIPYNWLREPTENLRQEEELLTLSFDRGELSVQAFSEENQLGVGCVRCHGPELRGGVIQSGASLAYPPNLTNICAGPFGTPPHNAIFSQDDIFQVLEEGRNAMPSWSIRYQGALNDQQINDLVVYLVEMSSENVPFEDNVCLNQEASDRALAESDLNPRDP